MLLTTGEARPDSSDLFSPPLTHPSGASSRPVALHAIVQRGFRLSPQNSTPNPSPSRYVHLGTTGVSQIESVSTHARSPPSLAHASRPRARGRFSPRLWRLIPVGPPRAPEPSFSPLFLSDPTSANTASTYLQTNPESRPFQLPPQPPQTRPPSCLTRTPAVAPALLPASALSYSQILIPQQE